MKWFDLFFTDTWFNQRNAVIVYVDIAGDRIVHCTEGPNGDPNPKKSLGLSIDLIFLLLANSIQTNFFFTHLLKSPNLVY